MLYGDPADWAATYELSFPVLDDSSYELWERYDGYYIPLNLVLDRNLIIRYRESGFYQADIELIIQDHLSP